MYFFYVLQLPHGWLTNTNLLMFLIQIFFLQIYTNINVVIIILFLLVTFKIKKPGFPGLSLITMVSRYFKDLLIA